MIIPDYSNNNRDNPQQRGDGEGNQNQEIHVRQSRRLGTYARQNMNRNQTVESQKPIVEVKELTEEEIKRREEIKQAILRGIICFLVPLSMIAVYSIFLKSYFTAFYILFAGLLIIFTFEKFYVNPKMPTSDNRNDLNISLLNEEKVELRDFRVILWIVGTIVTFSVWVFKLFIVIYYNVHDRSMPFEASNNLYVDLELYIVDKDGESWQNIIKMFLPTTLILINSVIVFVFRAPQKYLAFKDIKVHKKRSNLINFCKTLVWICLIGAQAFNVSLQAYIFYFIFLISLSSLFFSTKIKNFFDEYVKHFIKVVSLGILVMQFLCTTQTFRNSIQGSYWTFQLFGMNLITDFDDNLQYVPFYFISMWLLLILTVFCADLIKFERLVSKVREISEEYQKKYGGNIIDTSMDKQDENEYRLSSDNEQELSNEQLNAINNEPNSSSSDSDSSSDEEDSEQLKNTTDLRTVSRRLESLVSSSAYKEMNERKNTQQNESFGRPQNNQINLNNNNNNNEEQQIESSNSDQPPQIVQAESDFVIEEAKNEDGQKNAKVEDENISKTSKVDIAMKKAKTFGKKLISKWQKFKRNFRSEIYTLRLLQIVTIFLIQRYYTYYSLGLMAWVLLTGFTINHKFTMVTTFSFAIPSIIAIYIFLIFQNIDNNPFIPSWASQQYGFEPCKAPWLEVIILNVGLFLYFFYCKQVLESFKDKLKERYMKKTGVKFGANRRTRTKAVSKKKEKSKEISYFVIFQAFILKYSYLLALFMVYWISFYAINLVHVGLVALFLIFFSNMNTVIRIPRESKKSKTTTIVDKRSSSNDQGQPTEKKGIRQYDFTPQGGDNAGQPNPFNILDSTPHIRKSNDEHEGDLTGSKAGQGNTQTVSRSKKFKQITFGRRYWIIMVIYVELYLIARYIYFLIFDDSIETNSDTGEMLEFIGVSCKYNFPIHLGLTNNDFADESIIWILFYFIILQYDSYKSKIYMKYSHKITDIFAKKPLIKKIFPNFLSYVTSFNIAFYSLLIWVSFIVISGILILVDYSFLNTYLLVYIIILVIYFVKRSVNKSLNYVVFQRIWYFFTFNLIIISFTRYFLQLTSVTYVSQHIIQEDASWYQMFQRNRALYGFYSDSQDDNLRIRFLPGIVNIFFAVLCLDYFRLISEGYRISRQLEKKQLIREGNYEKNRENSMSSFGGAMSSRKNSDTSIVSSMFEDGEVLDSQLEKQKAIETLKMYQDYVQVDVLLKYKWMNAPAKWISLIFTDLLCFLVIIFCIYFKISLSMLFFLSIYLYFYFKTHTHLLNYIEKHKLFEKISEKMLVFKERFLKLKSTPMQSEMEQQNLNDTANVQRQQKGRVTIDNKEMPQDKHERERLMSIRNAEEDADDEELLKNVKFISIISMEIKIKEKEKVWVYSFYGSVIFLLITYSSSFLLTSFAESNLGSSCNEIQWGLFIFGTQITEYNTPQNTWRNIYFYVLLFWLNVLDLKCLGHLQSIFFQKEQQIMRSNTYQNEMAEGKPIQFGEQKFEQEQEEKKEDTEQHEKAQGGSGDEVHLKKVVSQFLGNKKELEEIIEDEEEEQANYLDKKLIRSNKVARLSLELYAEDFDLEMNESEFSEKLKLMDDTHFSLEGLERNNQFRFIIGQNRGQSEHFKDSYSINNQTGESIIDQVEYSNIANYFKSKKKFMEMRIIYSTLFIIQRLYVLILLFDSNTKQNGFSWIYLMLAAYFWVRTPKSSTIKALNRWSISILLLQYIFLLLNINPQTSLIPIPDYLWNLRNMSVVDNFLSNTQTQSYLAFESQDNVALLLNALIIFLIEMYFMYFIFICSKIMKKIKERKILAQQFIRNTWINFRAWKNSYISFLTTIYEGILLNFHLIVVIICIILSCFSYECFNLITTAMCLGYFFYFEFIFNKDARSEKIHNILLFFRVLRIYTFVILVIYTVLKIPQIDDWVQTNEGNISYFRKFLKQEVIAFHISEKIFVLFFIQLVFDIMQSKDHKEFLKTYEINHSVKSRLRRKCIAYQFNNEKLKKIEKRLIENKELIRNVQEVQNQLDNWHATIDMKSNKPNFKNTSNLYEIDEKRSISSMSLVDQVKQAKDKELAKKKEESANNLDTFFTPEELEKEKEKKSTPQLKRYIRKFATMFKNSRSEFLFKDELGMLDYIIKNNPYILECVKINLVEYLTSDLLAIEIILDFLDNLYANIFLKIRTQGIEEYGPDKLRRNLQKAASADPDILDDFEYLKANNSMKSGDIEGFRKESEIYSNYDRVMLHDQNNRFKMFNLDEERWYKDKNKGRDTLLICLLKFFGQFIVSGWSYICYIFFLFYYYKNDGLLSMFFPIFVFMYFMVEEKIGEILIWEISFIYVSFLIIFKFINSLSGLIQSSDNPQATNDYDIKVFFDSNNSLFYEGFLYFLIYIQLNLIRRMGLDKKMLNQEENTHMSYIRLKVNKFIRVDTQTKTQYTERELDFLERDEDDDDDSGELQIFEAEEEKRKSSYFVLLQKSLPESLLQSQIDKPDEQEQQQEKLISTEDLERIKKEELEAKKMVKQSSQVNKDSINRSDVSEASDSNLSINSIESEFTQKGFYKQIEDDITENPDLIDPEKKPNFFMRLFSKYTKKSGMDLYPSIAIIQVFLLFYIFIFYNLIQQGQDTLQSSLKFNQFSGSMVIIMIIQIIFMVWERYITLYTSEQVKDKEVERIKLIVRARTQGLPYNKNLRNLKALEKEISELERIKKEEEEYQQQLNRMNSNLNEKDNSDKPEDANDDDQEKDKEEQNKFKISQIQLKYAQLSIIVILFVYFTFFFIPQPFFVGISGSIDWTHFETNGYLGGLYFFFSIYFVLSCTQIKVGYNQFKIRNTVLMKKNLVTGICAKSFRAIPFLQELKVVMDWTFTSTTLDLFQWFKVEDIHFYLFCAKVDSNDNKKKPVGMPQNWIMKFFMGWVLLLAILLLIFGPMILFSGLNPTTQLNNITNASFQMGLQLNGDQGNYYQFYQNSNIGNLTTVPRSNMTQYQSIAAIAQASAGQFQEFDLYSSSDVNWQLSVPSITEIQNTLKNFIAGYYIPIQFSVRYSIQRNVTSLTSVANSFLYPVTTSNIYNKQTSLNTSQVIMLKNIIDNCDEKAMPLPSFYISLLRLDTNEDSFEARPFTNLSPEEQLPYFKDAYINLKCKENSDGTYDPNIRYWQLSLDPEGQNGLQFFVLCDKYSSVLKGLSIITIYTSVILVIGKLIKSVFSGDIQLLMFTEQPHSDKLIKICDAIAYSRTERDLIKENLLYWELIDLLRSPEVVKMLTGSYSKVIINKRKKELEEAEKEEEKRLKKEQ